MRRCRGTLSTNLEATEVIRLSEHAESCPVKPHTFYHHQQLAELRRLASEDTRPVMEIYNELASNAYTSSDTAFISHRGSRPETQCTTSGPRDTNHFRPGGRICGSLLRRQQQHLVRSF
ncbi:hypothetical protein T02_2377 [Trichinella nativa]|uniref:Uncharacterized protein n=1 Tax=Trichinella nativa TaxID=6335 RepID=A0A0V1LI19_9BILA|nr:hypothetical protein T02_2377 [Trichinella nativa]